MRKGTKIYLVELSVPDEWRKRAKESQESILKKYGKKLVK